MKRIHIVPLIAVLTCVSHSVLAKSQTVALDVPTMDCATCPITIKAALSKVPGVSRAKVSYERREAVVIFDDSKTNVDELKKATTDAGYPSFLKNSSK